jgi:hypothetical protein
MNILIEPLFIGLIQTFISIVLISGLFFFGRAISINFFPNYNNALCNFLLSVIFFSQLLKIISFIGYFQEVNLILVITISIFGIYNLKFNFNSYKNLDFYFNFHKSFFEILLLILLIIFLIVSISPPTMADALDYHYGIPLYLLNFNMLPDPYMWVHGSLSNNGEFINALAIYSGTDNFGSFLQFFTLLCFIIFLKNKIKDKKKFIFIIVFILSSPTLLQLISGPKFLLFPQIATTTALLFILEKKKINTEDFLFVLILLMGASQFKLSFVLSGFILGLYLLYKSFKDNNKIYTLIFSAILFLIFFCPTILWNYYNVENFNYQNLLSPLPIEVIKSLQAYKENDFVYPLNILIPDSIGSISSILGFQFLTLFFLFNKNNKINVILVILALTVLLHAFLGMNVGRIYYEFILWLAVGVYFLKDSVKYSLYTKIISIQLLVVFCFASYFAIISIPTLFSFDYRDKFMQQNSHEYSAIKWVNENLPANAKIISELRSVALYKNDFIPTDWLNYNIPSFKLNEYLNIIVRKKINYIVLKNDKKDSFLKNCIGDKFLQSPEFTKSTRNPLNRNQKYIVSIYEFNSTDVVNCVK